ncbi:hypothetical protein OG21DRAFT_799640 [Imleria badia]|nr:hypothetical protein OG21DRAFT_799640 [Imleria badia]
MHVMISRTWHGAKGYDQLIAVEPRYMARGRLPAHQVAAFILLLYEHIYLYPRSESALYSISPSFMMHMPRGSGRPRFEVVYLGCYIVSYPHYHHSSTRIEQCWPHTFEFSVMRECMREIQCPAQSRRPLGPGMTTCMSRALRRDRDRARLFDRRRPDSGHG